MNLAASTGYDKPLPNTADPLMAPFWAHAHAGRLTVQRCVACSDRHMPATHICPACLGDEQEWETVSGRAELVSWVEFHKAYWGGFVKDLPYLVCLVKLEEGPQLYSNVVGAREEDLVVGQKMRVVFDKVTPDVTLPKFAPA